MNDVKMKHNHAEDGQLRWGCDACHAAARAAELQAKTSDVVNVNQKFERLKRALSAVDEFFEIHHVAEHICRAPKTCGEIEDCVVCDELKKLRNEISELII